MHASTGGVGGVQGGEGVPCTWTWVCVCVCVLSSPCAVAHVTCDELVRLGVSQVDQIDETLEATLEVSRVAYTGVIPGL